MILKQYKNSYRYNSDTIFLYDFISKYPINGKMLDIGSGCGILGLLLKRDFPNIELSQIEIQPKYLELSRENARINNIESNLIADDFLTHHFEKKFDFIVSNPPFYHDGSLRSENDSLYLSRHSSALRFDMFAKKSYNILKQKGSIIFCYDAKQTDALLKVLLEVKLKVNEIQFVHVDTKKSASLVMIRARRESKSLCKILPPLILYENHKYKKDILDIFKKADTNSEDV